MLESLIPEVPIVDHIRPIVKWAGGKRQLLGVLEEHFPKQFETYYEPFLGGAAVYFRLVSTRPPFKAVLSDINRELIITYNIVKERVDDLISRLYDHKVNYDAAPEDYFYKIRASEPLTDLEQAARLIFLNKTCFNGLYRVNRKNKFNVPFGRYSDPPICDEQNLRSVSKALNISNADITPTDFRKIEEQVNPGDFVYFDPPYQPINSTSNFTSYTKDGFTIEDQKDLRDLALTLHQRRCHVLVSNSDVPEIRSLYKNDCFKIRQVSANRFINSKASLRTGHTELIIWNQI
jgi:DNA adenine methylase